jgi:hypothetical protein
LYQALQLIVKPGAAILSQINHMLYSSSLKLTTPWDATFLTLPLAQNPSHLVSTIGPIILLVPIATGVFQFIQTKMMFPAQVKATDNKLVKKG